MVGVNGSARDERPSPRAVVRDELLRYLARIDDGASEPVDAELRVEPPVPQLDSRTQALVRLGALVATGAWVTAYERYIADAKAAGVSDDDILGTLGAVATVVGLAHLVSATAGVALGLGYDIDAAYERS